MGNRGIFLKKQKLLLQWRPIAEAVIRNTILDLKLHGLELEISSIPGPTHPHKAPANSIGPALITQEPTPFASAPARRIGLPVCLSSCPPHRGPCSRPWPIAKLPYHYKKTSASSLKPCPGPRSQKTSLPGLEPLPSHASHYQFFPNSFLALKRSIFTLLHP